MATNSTLTVFEPMMHGLRSIRLCDNSSIDDGSCGVYPIEVFLCTSFMACLCYRLSQDETSPSLWKLPLDFAFSYVGFGFGGCIAANLFLGHPIDTLLPKLDSPRWVYYTVLTIFLGKIVDLSTIRWIKSSVVIYGLIDFIACIDVSTSMYNAVWEAKSRDLSFIECICAGVLVAVTGAFLRRVLVNESGNYNFHELWHAIGQETTFQAAFSAVCFFLPWNSIALFYTSTIIHAALSSFKDGAGNQLKSRVAAALYGTIFR